MARQDWVSLFPQMDSDVWSGAGTVLNTLTTATISPQPLGAGIDAPVQATDWLDGRLIRVEARGFLTTTAVTCTATFSFASNLNNAGTYVTLATAAGLVTGTTVITGLQWYAHALIRCTDASVAGSVKTQGAVFMSTNLTAPTLVTPPVNMIKLPMPSASGETTATVNCLALQGIAMRCQLSAATATVQLTQWCAEMLN